MASALHLKNDFIDLFQLVKKNLSATNPKVQSASIKDEIYQLFLKSQSNEEKFLRKSIRHLALLIEKNGYFPHPRNYVTELFIEQFMISHQVKLALNGSKEALDWLFEKRYYSEHLFCAAKFSSKQLIQSAGCVIYNLIEQTPDEILALLGQSCSAAEVKAALNITAQQFILVYMSFHKMRYEFSEHREKEDFRRTEASYLILAHKLVTFCEEVLSAKEVYVLLTEAWPESYMKKFCKRYLDFQLDSLESSCSDGELTL